MSERGVDPECVKLAEHFLNDRTVPKKAVDSLAEAIQQAVEDWFADVDGE